MNQIFEYLSTTQAEFFKDIYPITLLIKYYFILEILDIIPC